MPETTGAAKPAGEQGWRVLAILGLLLGFASISTDLYLPAMPTMARAMHASGGAISLSVSSYLAGFTLGQLLWGPVGDRYGRRGPVAAGIVLFIVGSAGCGLSTTATALICWRVVQALGACAGVVLARAMLRDLFQGDRAARMLSHLMTVMAVAPMLGPALGGQILLRWGWQTIFFCLCGIGAITLALIFTLPETLPPERRLRQPAARIAHDYAALLRHRGLLVHAGAIGAFYIGVFAAIAGTSFAFIGYYHLSPQLFGLLFGSSTIGIMLSNQLNAWAVTRLGRARMLRGGAGAAVLCGIAVLAASHGALGGVWGLGLSLVLFLATNGFLTANAIASALADFPQRAGTASALVGTIQYGGGIFGSMLVGVLADGTPAGLGLVMALSGAATLGFTLLAKRPGALQNAGS